MFSANSIVKVSGSFLARRGFIGLHGGLILLFVVQQSLAGEIKLFGPNIGAASNLSQGIQPEALGLIAHIGVDNLRDGASWARAEDSKGKYLFTDPRLSYLDSLSSAGISASVVLNWGNPLYDGGATPHTNEAVRAFGQFSSEILKRFPGVTSLEVGNEFNGVNFVKGPVASMTPLERGAAYIDLVKAVSNSARAVQPDIKIVGGSTHSIAAGYLWGLFDAGLLEYVDALSIHPYTTEAEQFVRQVSVLRRHPAAKSIPLEITEFGSNTEGSAASHMLKNYCQFSLAGVSNAIWYPLNDRGDGMVPLYSSEGVITQATKAYQLITTRMQGLAVKNIAPDDFTYGCNFDDKALVLWGEARAFSFDGDVTVVDARGDKLSGTLELNPFEPIVVLANGNSDAGLQNFVTLGKSNLLADSFHQFRYPFGTEIKAHGDGFERFARVNDIDEPLVTYPGQERPGTLWNPYRGHPKFKNFRLTASSLAFGDRCNKSCQIVHIFEAPDTKVVSVTAEFDLGERSEDGIEVTISINGKHKFRKSGTELINFSFEEHLLLGDRIEFSVSPNDTTKGDTANYRITIREKTQ